MNAVPSSHLLRPSPETVHWGFFDAGLKPVLTVRSGDRVTIESISGSAEESSTAPVPLLDDHRAVIAQCKPRLGPHILTGPVAIEGAMPGDTLEVRIEAVDLRQAWGYNTVRPLKGSLPEDFPIPPNTIGIPIDIARREEREPAAVFAETYGHSRSGVASRRRPGGAHLDAPVLQDQGRGCRTADERSSQGEKQSDRADDVCHNDILAWDATADLAEGRVERRSSDRPAGGPGSRRGSFAGLDRGSP